MKKNIGILIYSLSGGGAERVVSYLLHYCKSNSVNYTLFLMNNDIRYQLPKNIRIVYLEKSEANEQGFKKLVKIPYLSFKYYKLLKKYNIEVSISFLTRPNYINMSSKIFKRKIKIILSERAYPSFEYAGKSVKARINRFLIRKIYPHSNLIISNSIGNANDLINNFAINSSIIKVIHNPVDKFKIDKIKSNRTFFDNNFINFITVGRLDDGKNHKFLINAINEMKNSFLRLYIFGEGVNFNKLLNLIKELKLENQIFLMGFEANIYEYLKGADCFLFGSRHEGFPNVILEALACELPVISTNCKSGPDEILLGKVLEIKNIIKTKFGILVPENNLILFVEALNFFIENREDFKLDKKTFREKLAPYKKEKILSTYLQYLID